MRLERKRQSRSTIHGWTDKRYKARDRKQWMPLALASLVPAKRHRRLSPESSSFLIRFGKDEVTGSNPVISSMRTCRNASSFFVLEWNLQEIGKSDAAFRPLYLPNEALSAFWSGFGAVDTFKSPAPQALSGFLPISVRVSCQSIDHGNRMGCVRVFPPTFYIML